MPYLGLSSFLQIFQNIRQKQLNVSMPYLGLSSFLQFQLLSLSTQRQKVSMPYLGLSSFLHTVYYCSWRNSVCVSMPYHGLSSFLPLTESIDRLDKQACFNALPRAFFFSTLSTEVSLKKDLKLVSMPYHGLSSFLRFNNLIGGSGEYCFNALPRAFFFSTLSELMELSASTLFQCPTTGFLLFYLI